MKTKVQAQRKFAQGAVIPPTLNISNVSIDRRIDVSPNKEKNIFHNRTSAKSLLDIVSFKNLHKHAQPIVLLERLEDRHTLGSKDHSSSAITITSRPSTSTVIKPNHEPKQQASSYSARLATVRQHKNSKTRIITPRLPMHLRSRVIIYNDSNKGLPYKKKNSIKDRKRVIASSRKLRTKKRPQRAIDEFSNDDDQPLTFFRKKMFIAPKDKNIRQKKLKRTRPKSVKHSEPCRRLKERFIRRILEVPDVISEIPESILAYVNDMDLTDSDIRPGTSMSYNCHDADPTSSRIEQTPAPETAPTYGERVPSTSTASIYEDPIPSTSTASVYENPVPSALSYVDPVPSTSSYVDPIPSISSDVDPVPSTSYVDPVPSTSYVDPVPSTSSYVDPIPNTSTSSVCQDPIRETSSNLYQDPVQGTSLFYVNQVPGASTSFLNDPTISICTSVGDDLEQNAVADFEDKGCNGKINLGGADPKQHVPVAGPFNEIETKLLMQPPFYRIKEIDNWVSSDMTFITPPPQVSTRKSSRNRSDQNLNTEIDLDICIGSKLTSLAAILDYGPSFYDCLCLNCSHCKKIHELLKKHKANSLKTMTEEENRKRITEESVANANTNPSSSNIVISNVGTEELSHDSITIVDDDDKIRIIDLTEDSNDVNFIKDSSIHNVVRQEIPVQNIVQPETPVQNIVQHEIQVQNIVQHEMPEQNVAQDEMPEQNDVQDDVPEQNDVQDETSEQNDIQDDISEEFGVQQSAAGRKKTPPRRRRKRGRGRAAGGPMTRQKTQAAANAKAKRKKNDTNDVIDPTLPKILQQADLINAPVFYPSAEEFVDPMVYLEKVMPSAAKFGLFKVVSPNGFQPPCTMGDNSRFTVSNQYIARLFSRWGPAAREMCTIRAYLASQKVFFSRAPLLDGLEVNLPKLFHTVQKLGGLKAVFNKKKWTRVAEELNIKTVPNPEKKFDLLCLKYLLPYDTLTKRERQAMMIHVEQEWCKKSTKMLARVVNPLHQQKRLLGDSEPSDDDQDEDDFYVQALSESEDCVVRGRNMCLGTFKKIADTALRMHFPPGDPPPTTAAVEDEYWRIVLLGTDHVSINAAFIDTGPEGYGFPKNKNAAYGKHPWNLKMLSSNNKNVLRFLGLASGVTIPSLHVGMVFSTSCWHRDPHGLPWIEYMHQGPDKIWYGVPEGQSSNFRIAAQTLCPTSCQHKPIWLSSDIAMIPPHLLLDQNVRLSRVIQRPGEFVVVMPKAYSCSISTGFTISESVYFATNSFLQKVYPVFQELRESCEPSIFSLEQLLISMSKDPRTPRYLQQQVHGYLNTIVSQELVYRNALKELKVPLQHVKRRVASWNLRDEEECQVCRTALYLSRVTGVLGKKSKLCQQHALRVLNDRKEDGKLDLTGVVLEVSMTGHELDEVILNLQKQLLSRQ